MHRIDSTTAGPGGIWVGKNQITGVDATADTPDYENDLMENVCRVIEKGGEPLVKGDYDQLYNAITASQGRTRNLNFNPTFYHSTKWGGLQSQTTGKMDPVGWQLTSTNGSAITNYSTPNGLVIEGISTSSNVDLTITQDLSCTYDALWGNDTFTTAGEVKKFTSSVKYKKVSGIDFTVTSSIGTLSSSETIINDVVGDSSTESIGTAYRQTQVNTKDLAAPVTYVRFKIHFAAVGAFSILIKNCDLTEGFTVPSFQTYGNYIAETAYIESLYGKSTETGVFDESIPGLFNSIEGSVGAWVQVWKYRYTLPIPANQLYSTSNTVTLTNLTSQIGVKEGGLQSATTTYTVEQDTDRITVEFIFKTPSNADIAYYTKDNFQLKFDWEVVKA